MLYFVCSHINCLIILYEAQKLLNEYSAVQVTFQIAGSICLLLQIILCKYTLLNVREC